MTNVSAVEKWARISLAITAGVVVVKLVAAKMSGSVSVLAEGLQSLVDVAMSYFTLLAIRYARRPADDTHPYGHGRAEVVSSLFQMLIVIGTAGMIAWQASLRMAEPRDIKPDIGMIAMGVAVVVNLVLIGKLRQVGKEEKSPALLGEAEHLRGDMFATLGVFAGLILYSVTGLQWIDPIAAIVFVAVGAVFAIRQLGKLVHELMDGSLPPDEVKLVEDALHEHPLVQGFHALKTRRIGNQRHVTLHVLLEDSLTFVEAHDQAEEVEDHLSRVLGGALVEIHFEPYRAELAHRRAEHGEDDGTHNGDSR
ncbi:MAG: cation transporter [Armatimonadetes bacterium]|nr:cation transporter [Armatimonadota bacterium]